MPWGIGKGPGDTVWMGTCDSSGLCVSFIQSIYHEYGSGIVLPSTGINWQNRGASFSLDANHINYLVPGKKPFHTLNPATARFKDGRTMVYGNMGAMDNLKVKQLFLLVMPYLIGLYKKQYQHLDGYLEELGGKTQTH
jgi:gamma-glutamyltranspeptidase